MGDLHRARADAFSYAVEDGPRHALRGSDDPELAAAVRLAARLRSVGAVTPRPAFTAELRRRLLDEAAVRAAATAPIVLHTGHQALESVPTGPDEEPTVAVSDLAARRCRQLRVVAATATLIALGGGVGSAAAAQQAMPGDTLYGFKRGIESVATNVSVGDESRGRSELSHARRRLDEVRGLAADGADAGLISSTLDDFSSQARRGVSRLVAAYQQDGQGASIDAAHTFIADARAQLMQLAPRLPDGALKSVVEAVSTINILAAQAGSACPNCSRPAAVNTPAPTPSDSPQGQPSQEPAGRSSISPPPLLISSPPPSVGPARPMETLGPLRPRPSEPPVTHSPDPRAQTPRPSTALPSVGPTPQPSIPSLPTIPFTLPLSTWMNLPPWR